MGGFGSGRSTGRGVTNHCSALDVRQLHRANRLFPGQAYTWSWSRGGEPAGSIHIHTKADCLTLIYRHRPNGGDWKSWQYPVYLDWTSCNYGGRRPWFLCPASGCGWRGAVLYLDWSGIFACRHCNHLSYKCQRETDVSDGLTRSRNALDGSRGLATRLVKSRTGCTGAPSNDWWPSTTDTQVRHSRR